MSEGALWQENMEIIDFIIIAIFTLVFSIFLKYKYKVKFIFILLFIILMHLLYYGSILIIGNINDIKLENKFNELFQLFEKEHPDYGLLRNYDTLTDEEKQIWDRYIGDGGRLVSRYFVWPILCILNIIMIIISYFIICKIVNNRRRKIKICKLNKKLVIKIFLIITGVVILLTILINIGIILSARKYIYTEISEIPPRTVVLVLGAAVHGTRLSPVLEDRVKAGIKIMENKKGKKLLLSGDHGKKYYDEVNTMRLYVLANAPTIQPEDIFMDHAGFSTWDSMYRARDVFNVKDLIIVTQGFHISRAVIMARSLGMNAVGYAVNQKHFANNWQRSWHFGMKIIE